MLGKLIAICAVGGGSRRTANEHGYTSAMREDGNRMSHDEELRWVRRREGTHRSGSRETRGYDRDLLRANDTENLLGPTESRPASIDEIVRSHALAVPPRPTAGQELLDQVGNAVWNALEPHIEDMVDIAVDSAVNGISKLVRWAKSKPAPRRSEVLTQSPSASARLEVVPTEGASDNDDETGPLGVQMPSVTPQQYRAALSSALKAEQYAAHMRQLLAKVAVRDGEENATQAALEAPASSIDEATLRRAVERWDSSLTSDVETVRVRNQDTDAPLWSVGQPPS